MFSRLLRLAVSPRHRSKRVQDLLDTMRIGKVTKMPDGLKVTIPIADVLAARAWRVPAHAAADRMSHPRELPTRHPQTILEVLDVSEYTVSAPRPRIGQGRIRLHHQLAVIEDLELVEKCPKGIQVARAPFRLDVQLEAAATVGEEMVVGVVREATRPGYR
jgi:hypothetical protein